jgi:hypothetical protein
LAVVVTGAILAVRAWPLTPPWYKSAKQNRTQV